MPKIIGLTGGIGSGKTTIVNYIASLGIPVYIADEAGKKVMQTQEVLESIKAEFGKVIFDKNQLNRAKLAAIVFENQDKLKALNAIVHPAVRQDFNDWLAKNQKASIVVYESAILFESGSYVNFDYILTITAPLESRIERVLKRESISRDQVLKRINSQWTDGQRISKSDFVVENIDIDLTKHKIDEILKILLIKQ